MSRRSILLAFGVILLVAFRFTLGVDLTDESYYAAMALRFLQGDRPFVDELFVNQTGVLVFLPLVRAYVHFFGTEGLVLYLRALYFVFTLGVCGMIYYALSPLRHAWAALSAGLLAVAYVPMNIPALSYNTLGGALFGLSGFLGLRFAREGGRLKWVAAMLCLAMAEFAYPPLLVPGLFFVILASKGKEKDFLWATFLGVHLLVAVVFFPYVWRAGFGIANAYVYTFEAHHHGGGLAKGIAILKFVLDSAIRPGVILAYAVLVASRKHPSLLVLFPICLALGFYDWKFPSIWIFLHTALAAPILYRLISPSDEEKDLMRLVWFPGLLAGIVTAWISSSSPANLTIGLWGAALVGAYFLVRRAPAVPAAASLLVVFLVFLFFGKAIYCDAPVFRLTTRVPHGPFRGLLTSPEKAASLEQMSRDIRELEDPSGKIVFYEFPAGYLLTTMRIGVNNAWMRTESLGKQFYVNHYLGLATPRDLVFKINLRDLGFPSPVTYSKNDPFLNLLKEKFERVRVRPDYEIFRAKAPGNITPRNGISWKVPSHPEPKPRYCELHPTNEVCFSEKAPTASTPLSE